MSPDTLAVRCFDHNGNEVRLLPPAPLPRLSAGRTLEEVAVVAADGTATVIAAVDVIATAVTETVIGIAATASAGIGATEVTARSAAAGPHSRWIDSSLGEPGDGERP